MPGLDGLELVRRLRADAATRELPVILLSARAGEEARLEGLQAGASDYLVKPFSAREVLAYVEARLEIAAIRRNAEHGLRQSAVLNEIQRDTLALTMGGAPIQAVLQVIADSGRRLLGDEAWTAVYLHDPAEAMLRFGASSRAARRCMHERHVTIPVGADSLPCGRSAFSGRATIVPDLADDAACAPYLPLAHTLGVRSCWSLPICSAEGRVLGTYAVYRREPSEPSALEVDRMELLTQTAAVVLEHYASARVREAAEATLRVSEQRLNAALELANASRREIESLLDAAPLGVYVVDCRFQVPPGQPDGTGDVRTRARHHRARLRDRGRAALACRPCGGNHRPFRGHARDGPVARRPGARAGSTRPRHGRIPRVADRPHPARGRSAGCRLLLPRHLHARPRAQGARARRSADLGPEAGARARRSTAARSTKSSTCLRVPVTRCSATRHRRRCSGPVRAACAATSSPSPVCPTVMSGRSAKRT